MFTSGTEDAWAEEALFIVSGSAAIAVRREARASTHTHTRTHIATATVTLQTSCSLTRYTVSLAPGLWDGVQEEDD